MYPDPELQVGTGFWICTEIDEAVGQVFDIPATDDGRHFCLSFHLKRVCNSYCIGRHSYRPLSQEGLVDGLREPAEGPCNGKLLAQAGSPPRGGRSVRTTLPSTGSAPMTGDDGSAKHNLKPPTTHGTSEPKAATGGGAKYVPRP